jgi:hypothetical protein
LFLVKYIILDGSNTVKGFYSEYPDIYVPSGKALTIQGTTGSLNATSNGYAAGISAGSGDITIITTIPFGHPA